MHPNPALLQRPGRLASVRPLANSEPPAPNVRDRRLFTLVYGPLSPHPGLAGEKGRAGREADRSSDIGRNAVMLPSIVTGEGVGDDDIGPVLGIAIGVMGCRQCRRRCWRRGLLPAAGEGADNDTAEQAERRRLTGIQAMIMARMMVMAGMIMRHRNGKQRAGGN